MIQTLFGSQEQEKEKKPSFFDRMKQAVTRTRETLAERIEAVVSIGKEIDRNTLDDLEATLIGADLGTRLRRKFSAHSVIKPTENRSKTSRNSSAC